MRLISHDEFVDIAEETTVRIVDGQVQTSSADAVQFFWEQNVNYVALAKIVFETIVGQQHVLFFHEYGIWPSSENRYLFRLAMKALLNVEVENPTQYIHFSSEDRDAAKTLLQIGLQSGWGGLLLGGNDSWFYFDHDQFGLIRSPVNVEAELRPIFGVKIKSSPALRGLEH